MKRIARNYLLLLGAVLALSALGVAQSATYQLHVNVPFDFYAADHQLPAGKYVITVNYEDHDVTFRNKENGRSFALIGVPADAENSGQAVVEFDVVGNNYTLADLKTSNAGVEFSSNAHAITTAKLKRSVAIVATLR